MKRYQPLKESKIFPSLDALFDFDNNVETGDKVVIKNIKDQDGNIVDLEIINAGLDASWRHIKYRVKFLQRGKVIQTQNFKNSEALVKFLDLNNMAY